MSSSQRSRLDAFLRLFADVRAGEGITALLLASNIFLLLASYYIIKAIRDGLILGEFGAVTKSYTSAGAVFLLVFVVPLYGKLADRLPRRQLINRVTMFFVASFVGFYGLWAAGLNIGVVFYAWVAVFNVMIIAQFWSFANDVYTKAEGERLFPIVAFGQSVGAVVGTGYVAAMASRLGIGMLLLSGAALLFAQVQITNYVDRRERRLKEAGLPEEETSEVMTATGTLRLEEIERLLSRAQGEDVDLSADFDVGAAREAREPEPEPAPADTKGAFALVFRTRYLLMIGLLMMMLNLVNTTGEFILDGAIIDAAAQASGATEGEAFTEQTTIIKARFFTVVNIAGVLIQLFVVSRVVQFFGVGVGLMILPLISLGGYGLIALFPIFPVIRWAKTAENSTDYSLNNTVRNMLFLPATREQKYKAKQTIDSFFSRVGDTLQAVVVFFGTSVFALSVTGFALVNMSAALIWLVLAVLIGREYRRLVKTGEAPG